MIFETLGDWEVARAVGVYARIPVPEEWKQLLPKPHATSKLISLEYAVLRGSPKEIQEQLSSAPSWKPLSNLTAHLIYKFSRTDVLEYLAKSRVDLYFTTTLFTDLPWRASSIYGNTAVLEITWSGTHNGPLNTGDREIPPTGKKIELRAIQVVDVANDKVKSVRQYFDMGTLLHQIGADH